MKDLSALEAVAFCKKYSNNIDKFVKLLKVALLVDWYKNLNLQEFLPYAFRKEILNLLEDPFDDDVSFSYDDSHRFRCGGALIFDCDSVDEDDLLCLPLDDVAIETIKRLEGTWKEKEQDNGDVASDE